MLPSLDIPDAGLMECHSLREMYTLPESHFKVRTEEVEWVQSQHGEKFDAVDARYLKICSQMAWDALGCCESEVHLAEYDLNLDRWFLLVRFSHTFPPLMYRLTLPLKNARYLNDRGTLADERWKALEWRRPKK